MGDPLNELADHGVQVGDLFGKPALKDKSGKDRPMKDWVRAELAERTINTTAAPSLRGGGVSVPPAHSARWLELAELALSAPR